MKWVLVIEPSEVDRAYLERIISRLGYRLYAARNGKEALHFLTQSIPDTIIVGERIPDYQVMDFAREIKEDRILASPPMLLMSSSGDEGYLSAARQAGFSEIVNRPMSIRKFFTKLEACLSNNRRLCIRAPMEVPVGLKHGLKEFSMTTFNLGEGGMYLPTEAPLPRLAKVGLNFNLPGLRTLFRLSGQVMHAKDRDTDESPAGMGLQFLDISPAIQAVLGIYMENFLAKRLPVSI